MTEILPTFKLKTGWIWAKNSKSNQTWLQVLEDSLSRFQEKFQLQPAFALVHPETFPEDYHEVRGLVVLKARFVLKDTILLGIPDDKIPEV